MNENVTYSVFYKPNLRLVINESENVSINKSDIVSISFMNQYDTKSYPMIRLRLYSDITLLQKLTGNPDAIEIRGSIDGCIYMISNNDSPQPIKPTKSIQFGMKVYIEYKNTPTSEMDKYVNGIPKSSDLNVNNKVPIELYCYNYKMIHSMSDQPQAVWKDMNLPTIISSMLSHCGISNYHIDIPTNQKRYDQVLIPNLRMIESLSFFDMVYGLYPKGGQVFGDIDKLYICDLTVTNGTTPLPIYVKSYNNNSDMSGLMKVGQRYFMQTEFANVSIMSESDIEKVLMSESVIATNVTSLSINHEDIPVLKDVMKSNNGLITTELINSISPEIILHKGMNEYVASSVASRINEKITRIDLSGAGFDIASFKPNSRFNLIFESPIRGMNIATVYRPEFVCHTITPSSQELFTSSTTMTLCTN